MTCNDTPHPRPRVLLYADAKGCLQEYPDLSVPIEPLVWNAMPRYEVVADLESSLQEGYGQAPLLGSDWRVIQVV